MGALLGLMFGVGATLVWRSGRRRSPRRARTGLRYDEKMADMLAQAGIESVTPRQLVGSSVGLSLVIFVVVSAISRALPIAIAFGIFASWGPTSVVRYRRRKRRTELRDLWPEAVDNLASGVRAGLSLPEALTQVKVD